MKEGNVTVYIDAANLIKGSKHIGLNYSIENLLKFFIYKYKASRCVYFSAYFSNMETDYRFLEGLGVELVFREMSRVNNVIILIQKGKGPAIHARVEGTLFISSSIASPKNLSTSLLSYLKMLPKAHG